MKPLAIKCNGVRKFYGNGDNLYEALKKTNLEIYKNELTLLVGPSGSGKTTLISIIATILTPDEGSVEILDQSIEGMSEVQKAAFRCHHIGIVFQSLFLIPTLTIAENVALPLIVAGAKENFALEKAHYLLEKVNLKHKSGQSPRQLSKGQQQRVAIARAMINDAAIMICDEPTSSLDHQSGFEMMEYLKGLAHDPNKSILVVTHDPRIFSYADRIIAMSDGEITQEGDKNE